MSVYEPCGDLCKPCPWCGTTDKLVEYKADYDAFAYCVQCERCGCDGPRAKGIGGDAIKKWNDTYGVTETIPLPKSFKEEQ